MSKYKRYTSQYQINRENSPERKAFENGLIDDFLALYSNEDNLNVKVERPDFEEVLDNVGFQLQEFARKVATNPGAYPNLQSKLDTYPVPPAAAAIMTPEFRVFCLALNALKQWLSAEQASMDRVLLGGEYKKKLKQRITTCVVTGEPLDYKTKGRVNFHHAMRDGRFPIPLSKEGHDKIEGQTSRE